MVIKTLKHLKQKGVSILVSYHGDKDQYRFTDKTLTLKDGVIESFTDNFNPSN